MKKKLMLMVGLGVVLGLASCGGSGSSAAKFDDSKNIVLYTRDTKSGTRDGFFTNIGLSSAKEDNAPLAQVTEAASNGDMILKVKNDEYGLGYISLASLEDSGVKGLNYKGVVPTEENVLNSSYKLTRNFNYVIRTEFDSTKKEELVKAFIAYMSTREGKATIQANSGIVSIDASDKSWDDIKSQYPVCAEDNSSITIKFGGSTSVDKICDALAKEFSAKAGKFVDEHNHTGSGDAFKYTQGAKKDDSAKLDIGFLSRELNENEAAAEGTAGKMCVDAIVAVVNKVNPLTSVTDVNLVKAYTGEFKTWNEMLK